MPARGNGVEEKSVGVMDDDYMMADQQHPKVPIVNGSDLLLWS